MQQVYSDADILLSSDWTPPITIAPATITTESVPIHSDGRKKTSSVSFSVEDNENSNSNSNSQGAEKGTTEVKKNKVRN